MLILAVDPARQGGAVVLHDGACIAAAQWRGYTSDGASRMSLVCARHGHAERHVVRGLATPWAVGMALRAWLSPTVMMLGLGRARVCAEAAHIGRSARTGLALSRFGGALMGPLEDFDPRGAAAWVEPDQWRAVVFRNRWWKLTAEEAGCAANRRVADRTGVRFMPKREAAKLESVRVMPGLVSGLAEMAARVGGADDVYDASGVGMWLESS